MPTRRKLRSPARMSPRQQGKHLGLRLTPEVAAQLEALVRDESKKAGPFASVNQASMVVGLIQAEYQRRKLGGASKP